MTTLRGAALRAHEQAAERLQAIREDYPYLIATGETHSQRVAQRLGFPSVATLERYLQRHGIPIQHCDPLHSRRDERSRSKEWVAA
jgi:hypothetical protein